MSDPNLTTADITDDLADDLSDGDLQLVDGSDIDLAVERLEGRRRCLTASVAIAHSPEYVWQVLTDYEQLSDFIPNLAESRVVGEADGCVLLRQVGVQSVLFLNFSAAVTLKMQTCRPQRIDFEMSEGDFKEFFGCWELLHQPDDQSTQLRYTLTVLPPRTMPVRIVERRLRHDLAVNLLAIRDRVESISAS